MSIRSRLAFVVSTAVVASFPAVSWAVGAGCFQTTTPVQVAADDQKTVVIRDKATLAAADFSLGHTLGAITKSGGGTDSLPNRIALLSQIVSSMNLTSAINPANGITEPITKRPGEAALVAAQLLNPGNATEFMHPVGLFNRFDQAPQDMKYCGEHRIVYEKGFPAPGTTNRMMLIFEGALPNPTGTQTGCLPVAKFWLGLKGKTIPVTAADLQTFYYSGLPGFEPVVSATHYGMPLGQIRGNLFVNPATNPQFVWTLREWHTEPAGAPLGIALTPATVGGSAMPTLYHDAVPGEAVGITQLRTQFQNDFASKYTKVFMTVDEAAVTKGTAAFENDVLFGMGDPIEKQYEAFESQATGTRDDPNVGASQALVAKINQALLLQTVPAVCKLTSDIILARAGAQTCGGCHNFAASHVIGGQTKWPPSLGFVQIDENSNLSPLLTSWFIPSRIAKLQKAIAGPINIAAIAAVRVRPELPASLVNLIKSLHNRKPGPPIPHADLLRLRQDVSAARAADRAQPGAFVQFRSAD